MTFKIVGSFFVWSAVLGFIMIQMMSGSFAAQHLNNHQRYLLSELMPASESIGNTLIRDRLAMLYPSSKVSMKVWSSPITYTILVGISN